MRTDTRLGLLGSRTHWAIFLRDPLDTCPLDTPAGGLGGWRERLPP